MLDRDNADVRPTSRGWPESPSAELLATDWPRGAATERHRQSRFSAAPLGRLSRRTFVVRTGLLALGTVGASLLEACAPAAPSAPAAGGGGAASAGGEPIGHAQHRHVHLHGLARP